MNGDISGNAIWMIKLVGEHEEEQKYDQFSG